MQPHPQGYLEIFNTYEAAIHKKKIEKPKNSEMENSAKARSCGDEVGYYGQFSKLSVCCYKKYLKGIFSGTEILQTIKLLTKIIDFRFFEEEEKGEGDIYLTFNLFSFNLLLFKLGGAG